MDFIKKIFNYIYKKRYYIVAGVCLAGSIYYFNKINQRDLTQIEVCYFFEALKNNNIKEIIIKGNFILFKSEISEWYLTCIQGIPRQQIFNMIKSTKDLIYSCQTEARQQNLLQILLITASTGFFIYGNLRHQLWNKKSQVKNLKPVLFNQIYGNQQIKEKLYQVIDFMKNPQKYLKIGARMRRGILLYGPPGTGKTMIARATACESEVDFLYCSASEFQQLYVGVGPKRVRQLFELARSKKNGCILFIDQFDAIGMRSNGYGSAESERNSTINQLLIQMDGFFQTSNIVVMAATNRQNMIDQAILRSGRFDTKIKTQLPNLQQRKGIIKIHLQMKNHNVSQEAIQKIASLTKGKSGAQLEYIVNESAYVCLKNKMEKISDEHLIISFENMNKYK